MKKKKKKQKKQQIGTKDANNRASFCLSPIADQIRFVCSSVGVHSLTISSTFQYVENVTFTGGPFTLSLKMLEFLPTEQIVLRKCSRSVIFAQ